MYAATSSTFISMYTQATRQMEVSMDLAAYTLSEAPSVSTMADHMFVWATTPDETDWGLFAPTGDTVTLVVHVVDSQKRLGKVVIKDFTSGAVIGQITASADHGSVQGNLTITWNSEYYQMTGVTPQGSNVFQVLSRRPPSDKVIPFTIGGGFKPCRPVTVACQHSQGCTGLAGSEGDPRSPDGTVAMTGGAVGISEGCALLDITNDASVENPYSPPSSLSVLSKKEVIKNTASTALGTLNVSDPADLQAVVNTIKSITDSQDLSPAVTNIQALPYSQGCAHWNAQIKGQATSVLYVPYMRVRRVSGWLTALLGGLVGVAPQQDWLSKLAATALNIFLQDVIKQQQTGLKPGQVSALGDVYLLISSEKFKKIDCLRNITENVTFQLVPNIAPPGNNKSGNGTVNIVQAWTTPSPPGANPSMFNLSFDVGGTAKADIPKGFKWTVFGKINVQGYEGSTVNFQTPVGSTVNINNTLKVLLQLKVYTKDQNGNGIPATVSLWQGTTQLSSQSTTSDGSGNYTCSFCQLQPGAYTLKGTAPPRGQVSQDVNVQIGILQEATLQFGPPKPPGP
ncbi:MAG: hypothetical protein IT210_03075 [Armatimonadetes bacterium]|nr:hypothetical protein [Armatimonadota bacterium]